MKFILVEVPHFRRTINIVYVCNVFLSFFTALSLSLTYVRQQHTLVINSKSNNRRRLHSHHGIRAFGLRGLRTAASLGLLQAAGGRVA